MLLSVVAVVVVFAVVAVVVVVVAVAVVVVVCIPSVKGLYHLSRVCTRGGEPPFHNSFPSEAEDTPADGSCLVLFLLYFVAASDEAFFCVKFCSTPCNAMLGPARLFEAMLSCPAIDYIVRQ